MPRRFFHKDELALGCRLAYEPVWKRRVDKHRRSVVDAKAYHGPREAAERDAATQLKPKSAGPYLHHTDHEAKMIDDKPPLDATASRIAMSGIIACLVLTAAGMVTREPIFGALGLATIVVAVIFRRQIAKLISRR